MKCLFNLFKKKQKVITALEIDNEWLKIVQAQTFGKETKISKIVVEKVSSFSDEIFEQIKSLSRELKIDSNFLIVSMPNSQVAVRNLDLPSTNPAEIKDMVELQVGKQTPFTKDEIIYDYEVLNTTIDGYSRIILAIVHKDIVRKVFKILEEAGFKTDKIALSSEGLLEWSRFSCGQKIADKPYVLVNVNYYTSDFEIILKDKLLFCRNISLGFSQSLNRMDEWQKEFVEQMNHSIYAYQNEMMTKDIGKIIITGVEILTAEFNGPALKDKLALPVEIIPQFKDIPVELESGHEYKTNAKNVSLAALLGFVLTGSEQKINLVPQEILIERGVKERGRELYLFGVYLVLILVTVSSLFLGRMYNKEQYLNQLKQETIGIQEEVNRLDGMMDEVELSKKRSLTKDLSLNLLYGIHKVVLPEVHLMSISFNGKDYLVLRGVSNNMPAVFTFVSALEESEYFQNVKTKYATQRKAKGREVTDFEISCLLEQDLQKLLTENR